MKKYLAVAAVCLVAAPAFGGEVPASTLSSLGLGDMQVMSDVDGMQVRGMSSSAFSTSFSGFSGFLFDPFSGASFSFNSNDFGQATDENAGLNAASSANVATTATQAATMIMITTGTNTWTANLGAFNITGMATSTSP